MNKNSLPINTKFLSCVFLVLRCMRCHCKETNVSDISPEIEKSCQFTKFPVFLSSFFFFPSENKSRRSCFALTGWEAHVQRTSAQEVNVQVIFIPFHVVLLIPQIGFQKSFTVSVLQSKPSFNVGILKKKLQSKHVCFTSARCDVWGSRPQCGSQLCWERWLGWCWTLNGSYWSQTGDQPPGSLTQYKKL